MAMNRFGYITCIRSWLIDSIIPGIWTNKQYLNWHNYRSMQWLYSYRCNKHKEIKSGFSIWIFSQFNKIQLYNGCVCYALVLGDLIVVYWFISGTNNCLVNFLGNTYLKCLLDVLISLFSYWDFIKRWIWKWAYIMDTQLTNHPPRSICHNLKRCPMSCDYSHRT